MEGDLMHLNGFINPTALCLNFHFLATSSETISRQAMKIPMALIATGVLVESYRAAAPSQTEASGWRRFPFYLQ